jgi:TolA-binding protein
VSAKIDKKTLKRPDAFFLTSDKIAAWVEQHAQTVAMGVALIALVGLGWVGYGFLRSHAENQAAEALYGPEAELKKAETAVREERAKKMQELAGLSAKDKKQAKPETLRPVDFAKDYGPFVKKIEATIKDHANTKTALVSALNLSYFLLQQKQYEEALNALNTATYEPSHSDILGGFWLMHRGLVLMENKKYDDAGKAYQAVLDSRALNAFHPEALLKLGVAFELKGEADKARQTYEKLGREFPDSEASSSARQYLRLLELKSQRQG